MRTLERNKRKLYYATYKTTSPVYEDGYFTGQYEVEYNDKVELWCNYTASAGEVEQEFFGLADNYDRVLVLKSLPTGFDNRSVLWIGKEDGSHNYVVKKIADSLNSYLVAVEQVEVTESDNGNGDNGDDNGDTEIPPEVEE